MPGRITRSQAAAANPNASGTDAVPPVQVPPERDTKTNSGARGWSVGGRGEAGRGGSTNVSSAPQPAQTQADSAAANSGVETDSVAPPDAAAAQPNTGGPLTNGSSAPSGSKRGASDAPEDAQDPKRQRVGQDDDRPQDPSAASLVNAACETYANVLRQLRNSVGRPDSSFVPIPFGQDLELDRVFEANATVTEAIAENAGPTFALYSGLYTDSIQTIARSGEPMLMPIHQARSGNDAGGHIALFTLRPIQRNGSIEYQAEYHDSWRRIGEGDVRINASLAEVTATVQNYASIDPAPTVNPDWQRDSARISQQGPWQCGIHTILSAWTYALGLEAPSEAPTGLGSGSFYQDAVDMINLARRGEVSSDLIRNFLACYGLIAAHSVVPRDRSFDRTMPFGNQEDVAERAAKIRLESELDTILPDRRELPDLQKIIEICRLWNPDGLGILWARTGHDLIRIYGDVVNQATAIALSVDNSQPRQTSSGNEGEGSGQPSAVDGSSNESAGTSGDFEGARTNTRATNAEQDVTSSAQTPANAQTNVGPFDGPAAPSNGSARSASGTQTRSGDGSEPPGPPPVGQPPGAERQPPTTLPEPPAPLQRLRGSAQESDRSTVARAGEAIPARARIPAPPGPFDGGFPRQTAAEEMQRVREAYRRLPPRPIRRRASSVEAESRGQTRPVSPTPAQIFRGIRARGDMAGTDEHAARVRGDATGFLDEPYPEARLGIPTREDTTEAGPQRDGEGTQR
ncbi:hypothetical protein Tdes44962_MAKER04256 [Teratosphaeria destructans]|uniref:Ubiquitin-like protease family profile domain-containing protein n=1 Tax=Teratosphaeria destructans TaxID=418781 RepID=A0A9W7W0M2_9PEZI|nr:hypothetical protein Tdes44962_MAKER04256 [Teratosphaeria destructans]